MPNFFLKNEGLRKEIMDNKLDNELDNIEIEDDS